MNNLAKQIIFSLLGKLIFLQRIFLALIYYIVMCVVLYFILAAKIPNHFIDCIKNLNLIADFYLFVFCVFLILAFFWSYLIIFKPNVIKIFLKEQLNLEQNIRNSLNQKIAFLKEREEVKTLLEGVQDKIKPNQKSQLL